MAGIDFGSIFGGVMSAAGGSGPYGMVATGLSIGGGLLKSADDNDTGVDDIAGDLAIAVSKIFRAVGSGEKGKAKLGIQAARLALDELEKTIAK